MRITIPQPPRFRGLDDAAAAFRRSLRRRARRRAHARPPIAQLPHTVSFPDQGPARPAGSHQLVHDLGPRQLPLSILDSTSGKPARRLRIHRGPAGRAFPPRKPAVRVRTPRNTVR